MSVADLRQGIVQSLAQTELDLRDARAVITGGEDPQKVQAAGEFEWLVHRRVLLRARLAELDRRVAEHLTVFAWVRQMWFDLMLQLDSWIAHG